MTSTQDIKLLFPPYDCQPNQRRFDKFQNDLLASGGNCDVEGWSLADCLNALMLEPSHRSEHMPQAQVASSPPMAAASPWIGAVASAVPG